MTFPDNSDGTRRDPKAELGPVNRTTPDATYLLPHLHDLEALKVVESPPLLHGRTLLCPCALVELLLDLVLLPLLRNVTDTAGAGKLGNDDRCEGEFGKGDLLAGDGGLLGRTIDENLCLCERLNSNRNTGIPYTLVVNDLDNGSQATLVLALVEEDHTANLDQPPGARCDFGVTHFVGCAANEC